MEEFPPSYEMATARDGWALVAPYIPSTDLCTVSLVCRKWHEMFVPFLWGAPASHFGEDTDAAYVALTRFRRSLPHARRWVRDLTHTLHLPPALTEIYGGPRSTWLLEVLYYLPNLQSLLVSQLPFFDHSALMALGSEKDGDAAPRSYGLRLLLAQQEPNTTSASIAEALMCFPRLVYLDLSYTTPARDKSVISAISHLSDLQTLKLRGVGLGDGDVESLAKAIGTRVRLLDVRNNALTDHAIGPLLQNCFLPPDVAADDRDSEFGEYPESRYEWSLSASPSGTTINILSADSFRSELLDDHLRRQLSVPLTGRAAPENIPHRGITHLYLADNHISVEGLVNLLRTGRLHVLDGGTVDTAESIKRRQEQQSAYSGHFMTTVRFSGAEKLVPALAGAAAKKLTYLRAHHAAVTEDVPVTREGLSTVSLGQELPAYSAIVEESQRRRDTSVPASGTIEKGDNRQPSRAHGDGGSQASMTTTTTPSHDSITPASSSHPLLSEKIQQLLSKRPRLAIPYFHPSHLPRLRTLTLTDVPSTILSSSPILPSLTRFLTACADEALLATLRAKANYSLPPGLARATAERQHAKSLFSLERIVLEITPVRSHDVRRGGLRPSTWMPQGYYNPGVSKSSTEDTDSENLWAAAVDDFSFFGEGESGVPDDEELGKIPSETTSQHQREPEIDLVQALADFRRAKRREYEALAASSSSPRTFTGIPLHVDGHWQGEVKVVRNPTPTGRGAAVVDSYGNYFEKGYLYS